MGGRINCFSTPIDVLMVFKLVVISLPVVMELDNGPNRTVVLALRLIDKGSSPIDDAGCAFFGNGDCAQTVDVSEPPKYTLISATIERMVSDFAVVRWV